MRKRLLSLCLVLCLCLCLLPISANAANKTYRSDAAVEFARQNWSSGKGLCAEFVSDCLEAGGISSWSRGATTLYKRLVNEVEQAGIGKAYLLNVSGNTVRAAQNDGIIAAGDVVFWYCSSCQYCMHTALVGGVDTSGYVTIYQHNRAMNNARLYVNSCYECGRTYSDMIVIHFAQQQVQQQVQLTMRTWISDTNTTEWRAFVPSKFYTGERYYLWYKIYDPSTGLTLDEAYPGQSYTVTLEWYDYRGELVESVDYHNSLNWFGVQAKYAE